MATSATLGEGGTEVGPGSILEMAAQILLAWYGQAKALVLAPFMPVVCTVFNPFAGALGPLRVLLVRQIAGGVVWALA